MMPFYPADGKRKLLQAESLVEQQAKQTRLVKQDLNQRLEVVQTKATELVANTKQEGLDMLEELKHSKQVALDKADQEMQKQTRHAWLSTVLLVYVA